jgi:hypothetical protein
MRDETLQQLALGILLLCVAAMAVLLVLALTDAVAAEYQRASVYVAISLFVLGLALFVYERAFTPGVVWVIRHGKRVGLTVDDEWIFDPGHEELADERD